MGLVAVFKRQPFLSRGVLFISQGVKDINKFSKKCRYCMFHIFVALPDLYIVLFHIIKTYSSFWINDIYGIYIEFVILPPISKKIKRLGCTCGTDKSVAKFQVFFSTELGYHNVSAMAMSCRVDISFPK